MDIAVGVSHVVLVPLTATPALQGISGLIKSMRPEYRLQKWATRIEQIVAAVTAKSDIIPSEVMSYFLGFVEKYIRARCQYEEQVYHGKARWFWNKGAKNAHSAHARQAWNQGMQLSLHADVMHQKCILEHKNRNPQGKCLACFPDDYIAGRYGSQFTDTEAPLTWEFLLKSALKLSTHGTGGNGARQATATSSIIPQTTVRPSGSRNRPPSYGAHGASTSTAAEVNLPTSSITKTLGNEDVPELSIALDEEESQILAAVVGQELSSLAQASVGRGELPEFQSAQNTDEAIQRNEEADQTRNTDEIELAPIDGRQIPCQ